METRTYRAAPSAYLVFAGICLALEVLWLGAAWKSGVVTWAPILLIGGVYAGTVLWLARFRLEFTADELRVTRPFRGEHRVARADVLAVEFSPPVGRHESPFTLSIRVRDGEELRLNAKLFTREAVQSLLAFAPAPPPAAARAA